MDKEVMKEIGDFLMLCITVNEMTNKHNVIFEYSGHIDWIQFRIYKAVEGNCTYKSIYNGNNNVGADFFDKKEFKKTMREWRKKVKGLIELPPKINLQIPNLEP